MTQVVTVSANTAAYAAETLRPSARVSGQAPADRSARARAAEESRIASNDTRAVPGTVPAPAVTVFFLTAERQPNSTYQRAQEEYLGALAEYRAESQTRVEDQDDDPGDDSGDRG